MKHIISTVLFIYIFSSVFFCQNIYNSSDVKLKTPLKQDWSYKADKVILNQKIVDNVCFINTLEGVLAISLKDGKELWKYSYPPNPVIPSVVTFSEKYAVYITYTYDEQSEKGASSIVLIDLSSGKEKWNQSSEENWYKPTPFLDDKNIYCIAGPPDDWEENKDFYEMELDNAVLFAFSIADGNIVWQQELEDEQSQLIRVDGNYLFTLNNFGVSDNDEPKNELSCFSILDGTELWNYNPSGMITKAFIGDVKLKDNVVYAFPTKGSINSISAIDLVTGEELWQRNYIAVDGFYFLKNQLLTFGDGSSKTGTEIAWCAFELNNGDKYFNKTISFGANLDFIYSELLGKSVFGNIIAVAVGYGGLFSSIFGSGEGEAPIIIPTASLFTGLSNTNVLNDKGLFSIYNDDDIPILNIMNANPDDDEKIEYKLKEGIKDLVIANGTSPTSAFITYNGKVASINITSGKEEWSKEFEPNATSLGLIIKGDKMYLFTTNSVHQLSSE
jgi:hypothetical protein